MVDQSLSRIWSYFDPQKYSQQVSFGIYIFCFVFGCASLLSVTHSVWIRSGVSLAVGWPFCIFFFPFFRQVCLLFPVYISVHASAALKSFLKLSCSSWIRVTSTAGSAFIHPEKKIHVKEWVKFYVSSTMDWAGVNNKCDSLSLTVWQSESDSQSLIVRVW